MPKNIEPLRSQLTRLNVPLSGRESTVRLFDELIEETGYAPEKWMKQLIEKAA